jgi:hypothetical protein
MWGECTDIGGGKTGDLCESTGERGLVKECMTFRIVSSEGRVIRRNYF